MTTATRRCWVESTNLHRESILLLLSTGVFTFFVLHHYYYPSMGDALSYKYLAFRFRKYGIFYDFGNIRSYGYPLFLYCLTFLSGFSNSLLTVWAGICQFALLLSSTLLLSRSISARHPVLGFALKIAVLLNPLVLVPVADTLTEGLTIPLFIFLVFLLSLTGGRLIRTSIALCIGGLFSIWGLEIRPANIVMFLAWNLSAVLAIFFHPALRLRLFIFSTYIIGLGLAILVVAGPQYLYNKSHYGIGTILPACDIKELQLADGILLFKYSTRIYDTGAVSGMPYVSPFLHAAEEGQFASDWVEHNPGRFLITAAAHTLMSFAATNIYVYERGISPILSYALAFTSLALCFYGIYHGLTLARRRWTGSLDLLTARDFPLMLFIAFVLAGTAVVNAFTAIELRFNLIPICVSLTFAFHGGLFESSRGRFWSSKPILASGLVAALCLPIVIYIQGLTPGQVRTHLRAHQSVLCEFTHDGHGPSVSDNPFPGP